MTTMLALFALVWLLPGVLAYALTLGWYWCQFGRDDRPIESRAWFRGYAAGYIPMGPFGLAAALLRKRPLRGGLLIW